MKNKGQSPIQYATVILVIVALAGSWMAYSSAGPAGTEGLAEKEDVSNLEDRIVTLEERISTLEEGQSSIMEKIGVTRPAQISVTSVSAPPVKAGEEVTITVSVINTGGKSGTKDITLKVAGESIGTQPVTVPVGETKTVSFSEKKEKSGDYTVSANGSTTTWSVAAKAGEAPESIEMGFTTPVTGQTASHGKKYLAATRIWRDKVNKNGGVYVKAYDKKIPVKLVWYDDSSEPARCRAMYEKLITTDDVDFLTPPPDSALSWAARQVVLEHNKVCMGETGWSEKLFKAPNPLFFQVSPMTSDLVSGIFKYVEQLRENPPAEGAPQTIALVHSEGLFPTYVAKSSKAWAKDLGMDIVTMKSFSLDVKDMAPIARSVKRENPDMVLMSGDLSFQKLFVKSAKTVGLEPKILALPQATGSEFKEVVGEEAAEGIMSAVNFHLDSPWPGVKEWGRKFKETYGQKADIFATSQYAALQVWENILGTADSLKTEGLVEAIESYSGITVYGPVEWQTEPHDTLLTPATGFQVEGDLENPAVSAGQWQSGVLEVVLGNPLTKEYTESGEIFKTSEPIYPFSWD